MITVHFNILQNNSIEIEIPSEWACFEKNQIENYESFTKTLKEQIHDMSKTSKYANSKHPYKYEDYLENLKPDNFLISIIRMYTEEGFLYKEMNRILRTMAVNEFQNVNYFYIAMIAAFKSFYEQAFERLRTDQDLLIQPQYEEFQNYFQNNELICYRGSALSDSELNFYEKEGVGQFRRMNEFISTSLSKVQAQYFMNHMVTSPKRAFYQFIIPCYPHSQNCFAYLNNELSKYNEKEVLLKSGSFVKLEKIDEINPEDMR